MNIVNYSIFLSPSLSLSPQANAEYIHLADNFILVPGGTNNHNYANVDLILDLANRIPVQVSHSNLIIAH